LIAIVLAQLRAIKGTEMKWEYKVISVPIEARSHAELHAQRLEAALNEAGAERWEAVGVLNSQTVLMKRQIISDLGSGLRRL
jgi:hypothetical protein